MAMDPISAGGFSSAAGLYAKARPAYARAAVGLIADECDRGRILDVAAGTGILTGQLARAGCRVTGLEPLPEMIEQFRRSLPRVPALRAVAEQLPTSCGGFDGLTIAQAFHWMDQGTVLREVFRILVPGGLLALLWNVRDESVPWVRDLTDLVEKRSGGRPYSDHREHDWRAVVERDGGFEHVATHRYANPVASAPDMVLDRVRSTSFVSVMEAPARDHLIAEVRDLLASSAQTRDRASFEYPHHTLVHLWRSRAGAR